jgi:acyl carrier protein
MVIVWEQTFGIKWRDSQAMKEIRTLDDLYKFLIAKNAEMHGA